MTQRIRAVIKKITLHNFMSHAHSEIELSPGLTVLTGPNNCGKSAIVVALDVLSNNLSGDFMVRHGEKECYVSVELNDADVVTWRRKGKVTSYEINGREVHRLGKGGVPEDLHAFLRMPQIQHPGQQGATFDVHLAHQKAPIFLLDQPGSRAAMFFASSSDAEKLLRMQQLHRQKVRQARQTQSIKRATADGLRTRQTTLQTLPGIEWLAKTALDQEHRLSELDQRSHLASVALEQLGRAQNQSRRLSEECSRLQALASPPVLQKTDTLAALVQQVAAAHKRRHWAQARDQRIRMLEAPPQLQDTPKLRQLIERLIETRAKAGHWATRFASVAGLQELPSFPDPRPLQTLTSRLAQAMLLAKDGARVTQALATLATPPDWTTTELLRQKIDQLARGEARVGQAAKQHGILEPIREPPDLSAPRTLVQALARLEQAQSRTVRLEQEVVLIENSIRDVAENLHWAGKASAVADKPPARRFNPAVVLTAATIVAAIIGVTALLMRPGDIPGPSTATVSTTSDQGEAPSIPDARIPPTPDTIALAPDFGPDLTEDATRNPAGLTGRDPTTPLADENLPRADDLSQRTPGLPQPAISDEIRSLEQPASIPDAPIRSVPDSIVLAPGVAPDLTADVVTREPPGVESGDPSTSLADEIRSLERERQQLDLTVAQLQASIATSSAQLAAARKRLAAVIDTLSQLQRVQDEQPGEPQ